MRHRQHWFNFPLISASTLQRSSVALVAFSLVIFLIIIGEAIMSYFAPIYIESKLGNTFWMGIILSTSYVAGFITDILLGEWFKNKLFYHFLFWACLMSITLPLSFFLLPPVALAFFISMVIWGIYLELIQFSQFHFINHFFSHSEHSMGWSVLGGFSDAAYLVGPLLASFLINRSITITLGTALIFYLIGFGGLLIFMQVYRQRLSFHYPVVHEPLNMGHEFAVWKLLLPKIWPVLLFIFMLITVDATMWSVGALLSEKFNQSGPLGGLLFVAYLSPSLFMIMFAPRMENSLGKKRMAFILGLVAGSLYCFSGFVASQVTFIILIFFASMTFASLWPEIRGVIEDYVERLGEASNLMVSLESAVASLGYVLGTIGAGLVASKVGEQKTFTVMGLGIIIASIIGLVVMPRHVRLPQKEIQQRT